MGKSAPRGPRRGLELTGQNCVCVLGWWLGRLPQQSVSQCLLDLVQWLTYRGSAEFTPPSRCDEMTRVPKPYHMDARDAREEMRRPHRHHPHWNHSRRTLAASSGRRTQVVSAGCRVSARTGGLLLQCLYRGRWVRAACGAS